MLHFKTITTIVCLFFVCSGCASYVTPAAGVSLAEVSDTSLAEMYARKPASTFPANLAVMRVQDSGYYTKTNRGYGNGRYSIVTTRDVESEEDFERFGKLPLVSGVAPVGRMLLPANAQDIRDLRSPAAQLRADILLLYSIDTAFTVDGISLGPLTLVSLGLLPNKKAHVTVTVAGVLIDVRTGFVYGATEATVTEHQRATIWSSEQVIETARLKAEAAAFTSFVQDFEGLWTGMVNVHATSTPAQAPDNPGWYYTRN